MNKLSIDLIRQEEIKSIARKSLRSIVGGTDTKPSLSEITITKEKEKESSSKK